MNAVDLSKELRRAVETGKVNFGFESTQKNLLQGKAKAIIFAKNIPLQKKEKIIIYCKKAEIKQIEFAGNSVELGKVCGKQFNISCLSILEQGNSKILE